MRNLVPLLLCLFSFSTGFSQEDTTFAVKYFSPLPRISIRALEVLSDSTVWFAANHGVWGFTRNAGKTWHIDSIKVDTAYPDFRSISALNDSTVLLLSAASPAYLFKTTNKGKSWKLVYKNGHKNIFFDSMKFVDSRRGIAVGDPINGRIQLILTRTGGNKWSAFRKKYTRIKLNEGESFFASSNTCLEIYKNNVWFATGGKSARVFCASFNGYFTANNTPILQGGKMTGIFSVDFFNDKTGVIAGGNYEKTDTSIISLAITKDGGKTWKEIKSTKPFFGSCVQFKSEDVFFVTGHDGTFICSYKKKQIEEIKDTSGSPLKFHTLRFSPSGKNLWLAGGSGQIALVNFSGR